MTTDTDITKAKGWSAVIDAVLRIDKFQGTWEVVIYNADESEAEVFRIDAARYRAATMEATAWIKGLGYEPTERWDTEEEAVEATRRFKRAAS